MVLISKHAVLCNVNVSYNSQIKDISTHIYLYYLRSEHVGSSSNTSS